MKFRFLTITIFITSLFFTSCQKEEDILDNETITTADLLTPIGLSSDQDFIKMIEMSIQFRNKFINAVEPNLRDVKVNITSQSTIAEISNTLKLDDSVVIIYETRMNQKLNILKNRYPELEDMSEKEITNLFQDSAMSIYNYPTPQGRSCDSDFEDAIGVIHSDFDNGLTVCLGIALFTGGGGLAPCAAVVTGVAILETAVAIDQHTLCNQ